MWGEKEEFMLEEGEEFTTTKEVGQLKETEYKKI
jgi:hypothetical protein